MSVVPQTATLTKSVVSITWRPEDETALVDTICSILTPNPDEDDTEIIKALKTINGLDVIEIVFQFVNGWQFVQNGNQLLRDAINATIGAGFWVKVWFDGGNREITITISLNQNTSCTAPEAPPRSPATPCAPVSGFVPVSGCDMEVEPVVSPVRPLEFGDAPITPVASQTRETLTPCVPIRPSIRPFSQGHQVMTTSIGHYPQIYPVHPSMYGTRVVWMPVCVPSFHPSY